MIYSTDMFWLVVWNMVFYFPFHLWDVILPIDELHHFSRCVFNHQPDICPMGFLKPPISFLSFGIRPWDPEMFVIWKLLYSHSYGPTTLW